MAQLRSIMIHDQVYVSLRRAIMSGHFKPGDQLSARGLAKDFGISQMPVRDALNRLTSDRAVERTGDRRYCIPKLDAEYVADLRTARVINEGAATAIATSKMTKKAMQEINRAQELIEEAAKYSLSVDELGQDDVSEYVFLNKQFHFAIYKATKRQKARYFYRSLKLCGCAMHRELHCIYISVLTMPTNRNWRV